MTYHPQLDHHQKQVPIKHPHVGTHLDTWASREQTAVVVPEGPMPDHINGIPVVSWGRAPSDRAGWTGLVEDVSFREPPFHPKGLEPAAGAVIVEPDGRVWLVAPTNAFLGTQVTFPKGKANGLDLRGTALKEVLEESGLQVEFFAHLVDVTRSTSRTRYYLARRIGGNPADMGWESQAVLLVPVGQLKCLLNKAFDHAVVDALLAQWGSSESWWPDRQGPSDPEGGRSGDRQSVRHRPEPI